MGGGGRAARQQAQIAAEQRAEERARQARIREGMGRIDRIFDGGRVGVGQLGADAEFDPNATYYLADGTRWTPPENNLGSIFGSILDRVTGQEGPPRTFAEALERGLFTGVEQRAGFNDDFFEGIRQGFTDFAQPQLDRQFQRARDQNVFALARSGLLDSSVRAEQAADLQENYDTNLTDIRNRALDYETQARGRVEDARSDLVRTLQATGDADAASRSALARAEALSAPTPYSPIGQMFTDTTAALAAQIALERAEAAGSQYGPRFNTGLGTRIFGAGPRSVTTRG